MYDFDRAGRIVIKVGTSTLTHESGNVNIRRFEHLVKVLADIKNAGHEIILVSSGAIAVGLGKLGLTRRPDDTSAKQALAAIGQCELMYLYDKSFSAYNHKVAQVLLTHDDVADATRSGYCRNTFTRLLEYGTIPIVNENDTVAVEELVGNKIGDNDNLSAIVASLVGADALIILSDIAGLYTADPRHDPQATLIHEVPAVTPEIYKIAGGAGSGRGTGGMYTKIQAADVATAHGVDLFILSGSNPDILYDLFDGKEVGTHFIAGKQG